MLLGAMNGLTRTEALCILSGMEDDSILLDSHVKEKVKSGAELDEVLAAFDSTLHSELQDESWNSLFCVAIAYQHADLVNHLLEQGRAYSNTEPNPLHMAVHCGDTALAERLLDIGMVVHAESRTKSPRQQTTIYPKTETAVGLAIRYDSVEMMQLLRGRYNPDRTPQNMTLLHYACRYGAARCFDRLLSDEVGNTPELDLDARAVFVYTPLMFAVRSNYKMVAKLLQLGAQTSITHGKMKLDALESAIHWKTTTRYMFTFEMVDIVKLLLARGADVTVTCDGTENLLTALCYGARDRAQSWSQQEAATRQQITRALRCYLETAELLLLGRVWESTCRRDPIILAIKLQSQHAFTNPAPWITPKTSPATVAEEYFTYSKALIRLCLDYGLHEKYPTIEGDPAYQLIWNMLRSFTYDNSKHKVDIQEENETYYVVNDTIRSAVLDIFEDLLLHGLTLREPEDAQCLFTLSTLNAKFTPFLQAYFNSLAHSLWATHREYFRRFVLKRQKQNKRHTQEQTTVLRPLQGHCRLVILQSIGCQGGMHRKVEALPLPRRLLQYITRLHLW